MDVIMIMMILFNELTGWGLKYHVDSIQPVYYACQDFVVNT